MKYIKTFENFVPPFNVEGFITNIKNKLINPSFIKDYIDYDGDMVYIKIPLEQIKTVADGEKIINIANQYKQVKRAYIDGNSKSIMIQAQSGEAIHERYIDAEGKTCEYQSGDKVSVKGIDDIGTVDWIELDTENGKKDTYAVVRYDIDGRKSTAKVLVSKLQHVK